MATRAPGRPWWRRVSRDAMASSIGRRWPTPKRPSIQRAPSPGSGSPSSSGIPSQRQWRRWVLVRGLGRSKGVQRRTLTPARCSSRATTRPSPPLWPGPTSTRAAAGGLSSSRRAIARAAFSIRASTGRPLANSWFSSAAIWLPVTSRWSASAAGQRAPGEPLAGCGRGASGGMVVAVARDWAQPGLWTDLPVRAGPGPEPGFRTGSGSGTLSGARADPRSPMGRKPLAAARGKSCAPMGPAQFHDGSNSRPVCPKAAAPPLWPVFPPPPKSPLPVRPPRPPRPGRRRLSGCGRGRVSGGWRWVSRVGWIVP